MSTRAKLHTIELTENELARVFFVMRHVNGEIHGKRVTTSALEKLGVSETEFDVFHAKSMDLAEKAKIPTFLDYYKVQKEWESFLGIEEEAENNDILDRIANMERELAELKGTL